MRGGKKRTIFKLTNLSTQIKDEQSQKGDHDLGSVQESLY